MREETKGWWSKIVNIWGAVASIAGLVLTVFTIREGQRQEPLINTALILFGSALVAAVWVGAKQISDRFRNERRKALVSLRELENFRDSANEVHSIMHRLRDGFIELQMLKVPLNPQSLTILQRAVIGDVVTLIGRIFSKLAGCDVNACVSLCEKSKSDGVVTCFGWCHSRKEYLLTEGVEDLTVDGSNTRFYNAARPNEGGLSYFFSADLDKFDGYCDRARRWRDRYRSCLVIPIRKNADSRNLIGFLKLETLTTERLNESYHRELLSAFADAICIYYCAGEALISQDSDSKVVKTNEPQKIDM